MTRALLLIQRIMFYHANKIVFWLTVLLVLESVLIAYLCEHDGMSTVSLYMAAGLSGGITQ